MSTHEPDGNATADDQRPLVTVELIGLPLDIAHRSNEHHATLTRELAFIDAAGDLASTPARLLALSAQLAQKYSSLGEAQQQRAALVAASGGLTMDLRYEVPSDLADEANELFQLYEEIDGFCATGDLVSLVMPDDVAAFRRWVCDQFCSQIRDGSTPTPWAAPAARPIDPTPTAPSRPGRIVVAEDLDLRGAARLRIDVAQQIDLGVMDLELDLGRCEFVDSTGISMLLTTRARLHGAGGSVALVHVSDAIQRALRYAGVHDLLPCR